MPAYQFTVKEAYGFEYQKGSIFGFGEKKSDDTGTVSKLCDLDNEKINHQVQIHNLNEEMLVCKL